MCLFDHKNLILLIDVFKYSANKEGSCKRQTCECDLELYRATKKLTYNKAEENANCITGNDNLGKTDCCQKGQLFKFYNTDTHECCGNGDIALSNTC